jgi:hypothetical protein
VRNAAAFLILNVNMIHYVFYKLYRANLVGSLKDIAPFAAVCHLACLATLNLLSLYFFLRKLDLMPEVFSLKGLGAGAMVFSICGFFLYFYSGKKYKQIIATYSKESEGERKSGNTYVWIYLVFTILLVFLVAFFRPGKV